MKPRGNEPEGELDAKQERYEHAIAAYIEHIEQGYEMLGVMGPDGCPDPMKGRDRKMNGPDGRPMHPWRVDMVRAFGGNKQESGLKAA